MHNQLSVSFGQLTIDEFELGVGDNPAVSGGVPVMLSRRTGSFNMLVEEFEDLRSTRRPKPQLVLDRDTRMKM